MSWEEVDRLFREALDRPDHERGEWLRHACGDDEALRRRVQDLLATHHVLEGERAPFLEELDAERAAALLEDPLRLPGPGKVLGKYHVHRLLGRGGMGLVYEGFDPELQRPVALKVLPPRPHAGSDAAEKIMEEARAASALDHPHIGTVYEMGSGEKGERFIAMAWYEGGTLRERLRHGPLPVEEARTVARQVAEGLSAAHTRGLVHRDVKPENLVFDGQGKVRIVDFGLATWTAGGEGAGAAFGGTPPYMAPEQERRGLVDERADIFSLGVVLHEMLAGHPPASAAPPGSASTPGTLRESRPEVPEALAAVVDRCLAADPRERYPSAGAVAAALGGESNPGHGRGGGRLILAGSTLLVMGLALGVVGARSLPRVLQAEGNAVGIFPERGWVLVSDFDATDEVRDVALAAREALSVDLQQSRFVNVMSRAQVAAVLRRMGLAPDRPLDLPLAMEVAERFGAGAVVGTTVTRVGSRYVLSGRALDPATGLELFAVRTASGTNRVLGAVERLSREVRARLGEDPEALAGSLPLPEVTTTSLEALRLYAEAERELVRDAEGAARLAAAAIAADPDFAMAHRLAAAAATGGLQFGEALEHLTRAHALRERLPERERWHIEALHFVHVALEPRRAEEAYELLVSRYPEDSRAWHNLGVIRQGWLGEHEGSARALERAVQLDSMGVLTLTNATFTASLAGQTERADSLASRVEAAGGKDFLTRWRVVRAFARGDMGAVVEGCRRLLATGRGSVPGADDGEICGSMDVASGRVQAGIPRLLEAERAYMESRRYRNATHVAQTLWLAEMSRGAPDAAAAHVHRILDRVPLDAFQEPDRMISRINLAVQAELFGQEELAARIASVYPPHPDPDHWFPRMGEALVAAAGRVRAGEGDAALRILDQGSTPGHRPIGWRIWEELIRGLAHEMSGDLDQAAFHLRAAADPRFLTLPYATKDRIHFPHALHALLRVEEARGDGVAARAVRARLTSLRAAADPGLEDPVLEVAVSPVRERGAQAPPGWRGTPPGG